MIKHQRSTRLISPSVLFTPPWDTNKSYILNTLTSLINVENKVCFSCFHVTPHGYWDLPNIFCTSYSYMCMFEPFRVHQHSSMHSLHSRASCAIQMPQGIQVMRLLLIPPTLNLHAKRAPNKYPTSDLFPQPASSNRWEMPSPHITNYFNISYPHMQGSLSLKQILQKIHLKFQEATAHAAFPLSLQDAWTLFSTLF